MGSMDGSLLGYKVIDTVGLRDGFPAILTVGEDVGWNKSGCGSI